MTTGQRFKQVLEDVGLTNNGFATKVGVSSTVINGIVNDTNKPGNKVLTAMSEVFPQYNTDWILTGQGPMKKQFQSSGDYLQEHLRNLEKQFAEMREMFSTELSVKNRQIEKLMDLLGKLDVGENTTCKIVDFVPPVGAQIA